MKYIKTVLFLTLFTLATAHAESSTDVDERWVKAVEQKIATGNTTITTPSEVRAKAAEELARKHRRQVTVTKSDAGYSIAVQAAGSTAK